VLKRVAPGASDIRSEVRRQGLGRERYIPELACATQESSNGRHLIWRGLEGDRSPIDRNRKVSAAGALAKRR
jgi:hypothetical protein